MTSTFGFLSIFLQENAVLLKHEKIYAVLAVVLVIFMAFIYYLVRTDLKTRALEQKVDEIEKSS